MSDKNQKHNSHSENNKKPSDLIPPDCEAVKTCKKGILSHLKSAVLTVEAAFAVPIFFLMVICITSIMGIYSQTLAKMIELRDTAMTAAAAAGISDEETWIDLPGVVDFAPLFLPSGVSGVNVWCSGCVRAWTGRNKNGNDYTSECESTYVYVTENGTVYHTSSSCAYINLSISQVSAGSVDSLRNNSGSKYKPCEKCIESGETYDVLYITDYGEKYHGSASCSSLKRTVRMVDISTVQDLFECSKCRSQAS